MDSGDIIQFTMDLFVKDGEKFQRMFQLFTGHAAGQPLVRYLMLTDQFIYLLASEDPADKENLDKDQPPDFGASPTSATGAELAVEAFERNSYQSGPPRMYRTLVN